MRRPIPLGPMPTVPNAPVLIWVVGITSLPEIALTLGESNLIGMDGLRQQATLFGAFWTGLFRGWEPLFPGQRVAMFFTYALLHGGLMHLIGNMIATLALGGIAVARLGQWGFLLLYVVSAIGGGAGFALLSVSDAPMVGASGAVFGLAGAWKYWEWQARRAARADMKPLWRSLAGLALVNVLMWLALSGLLAWQAHLGGFVAGWALAAFVTPPLRPRR